MQSGSGGVGGVNFTPSLQKNGTRDMSIASGSDYFRSVRSDISDHHSVSLNRSQTIIVPSPVHQGPVELVCQLTFYFNHIVVLSNSLLSNLLQ